VEDDGGDVPVLNFVVSSSSDNIEGCDECCDSADFGECSTS